MKKNFLLFIAISALSISFSSCSIHGATDYVDELVNSADAASRYSQVVRDIAECKGDIAILQSEAKESSGGAAITIQEQIARKMEYLESLQAEKKQLEKQLKK